MAIVQTPQYWIKSLVIIGFFAVLTACGGGGGSDEPDNTPSSDTTPNTFSFTSVENVELGALIISNSVTITGMNAAAAISVSGGEYSIAGADYTSVAGTVNNNQNVTVRVTAANTGSNPVTTTLTVGGIAATFTVTTRPDDAEPDNFTFPSKVDVNTSTSIASESATISGINIPTQISIVGGEYSINDADFTSIPGTITNNQRVTLRLTSSDETYKETTATLTVGSESATFSVTTAPDVTPAAVSFTPAIDVAPGSEQTSNPVTVTDIDVAVAISIDGGEYLIDGGDYTSEPGLVNEGQVITVFAHAANTLETSKEVILTIGGVATSYVVTTFADSVAPTAEFMFPPPVSMTEGTTLRVRGKITDDYSDIASAQITVNGNAPQDLVLTPNDDGSSSWQADINLDAGENIIVVSVEDSAGNAEPDAAQVSVRQDVNLGSFPDANNPISVPRSIVIDRLNGRNHLLVTGDHPNYEAIFSVDLTSGARTLFTNFPDIMITNLSEMLLHEEKNQIWVRDEGARIAIVDLNNPESIVLSTFSSSWDDPTGIELLGTGFTFVFDNSVAMKLIAAHGSNGNLMNVSLDLTSAEIFSDNTKSEQGDPLPVSRSMVLDKTNKRYLLSSSVDQTIYAVDSVTGVRSIFSGSGIGGGDNFSAVGAGLLRGLKVDSESERVIVLERTTGQIFFIDMETRDRTIISSPTVPNALNPMARLHSLSVNSFESYAYVTDELAVGIFAVDLITGHRVYFSKN